MEDRQNERLTDVELHAFLDRLFPQGFAGNDALNEVAPDGWERSPLLACFHPSVEQVFQESVQMNRSVNALHRALKRRNASAPDPEPRPEPTLDVIRSTYQPQLVNMPEELTEVVGLCLWDVFSDNHDVVAADGRAVDIGSFRGASAFLDEHLTRGQEGGRESDYMRFYLGTIGLARRVDLTPVYSMIFRRLRAAGADWVYHFPRVFLTELEPRDRDAKGSTTYSVSDAAVAELNAQQRRVDTARLRARIDEANANAREQAMDREPPTTVRAYRQVYGRDPRGWPPA
jgi:hypothetical protein